MTTAMHDGLGIDAASAQRGAWAGRRPAESSPGPSRPRIRWWNILINSWLNFVLVASAFSVPPDAPRTVAVELKLRTGGELRGAVLDHNDHGLVVLSDNTPYVFAWSELEAGSAIAIWRTLLLKERGGPEALSAEDYFALGAFALRQGRNDLAANEFDRARKMHADLAPRIREAFDEFRRRTQAEKRDDLLAPDVSGDPSGDTAGPLAAGRNGDPSAAMEIPATDGAIRPSAEIRQRVREAYLKFGEKVREIMGKDITLIESDHFLIWTDWEKPKRPLLTPWCEEMYAALCGRFGLDPKDDIFLAKCPVFCFRSKARFKTFARDFDGYDGANAVGYTRSIEKNGHVHMVFARGGRDPADYDRFACTLVHEGTHAFLHRLYGQRLLPHWINEGYADLTAQRVLGDRCPNGGNAALLARQYARFDWPITALLESSSTIGVHQYPLAQSLVVYLEGLERQRFTELIKRLKNGATLAESLGESYDGMTFAGLEKAWKDAVREPGPAANTE